MNNVSRLLLARAEKAEKVLRLMVKANDTIEAICDDEIARLKAKVTELETELHDLQYEGPIEDEDGTIAHMQMLERQAEEACERDRVLYGPVPHD